MEVAGVEEKDFVLFLDKDGKFSGDYDAPAPVLEAGDGNGVQLARDNEDAHGETSQSAINEETGEINWDCPCLKSALAPPCGEFFREAFSCFVASKTEPKGSDCLDKFAAMQDCFRAHPEVYMRGDGDGEDRVATAAGDEEDHVSDTGRPPSMDDAGLSLGGDGSGDGRIPL